VHVIQVDRVTAEPTTDEMGQFGDPSPTTSSPPPPSKGSVFSLLRRKKKPELDPEFTVEPFTVHLEAAPPPPPPKDKTGRSLSYQQQPETPPKAGTSRPPAPRPLPQLITTRHRSNSDYTVVNHRDSSSSDEVVVVKPDSPAPPPAPRSPAIKKRSVTMPSKWNAEPVDPAERARRRARLQREREIEEQQALEEEAQRQIQLKLQKQVSCRVDSNRVNC
jgi:MAP7 domain-containing protein 1